MPNVLPPLRMVQPRAVKRPTEQPQQGERVAPVNPSTSMHGRFGRALLRYTPPVPTSPGGHVRYALRQIIVRAIERLLARPLREETMTWDELATSGRLRVGRYSYGRPTFYVYPGDTGSVAIGSFVSIGHGVEIVLGGNHRIDWVSAFPFRIVFDLSGALQDGVPASKGEVTIGNDVWIGKGAKILSGVNIGDGAAVGAYSVVAKDVRPYAVVVGNPAREVKRRFSDDLVADLQHSAWWHWPIHDILAAVPLLCSSKLDDFLRLSAQRSAMPSDSQGGREK